MCLCAGPLSSVSDGESTDKKVVVAALPLKVTIPISATAKDKNITASCDEVRAVCATLSAPAALSVSAGPSDNLSGVDDRGFSPGRSAMHVFQTDWQDTTSDKKTKASTSTGAAVATERACVHALHAIVLVACMHSGRPTYAACELILHAHCMCGLMVRDRSKSL